MPRADAHLNYAAGRIGLCNTALALYIPASRLIMCCGSMAPTPKDYAEIYKRLQAPISKVYDCGKKCAPYNNGEPVCCTTGHAIPIVEHSEYKLLRSRTDMWTPFKPKTAADRAEIADLKGSACRAVECKGAAHCERDNRSMACRSFPFFPYFNPAGELVGLATYWSFEGQCWVISNLTIVEQPFIDDMIASHDLLFAKDEDWRKTYRGQSATMRGVYSRKGKRFPVIGRNGDYFWVLPKSGGKMIPAKKSDLLKLRAGFPNFSE